MRYVFWLKSAFAAIDAWYRDYEYARDTARCGD